jgi:hypothetical protein
MFISSLVALVVIGGVGAVIKDAFKHSTPYSRYAKKRGIV